jgi:hypothetical protein
MPWSAIHTFEGTETMQTLIVGCDITGISAFTWPGLHLTPGGSVGVGYAGVGYAGVGYAGVGYAGVGYAGVGYAGVGYAGVGYAGVGYAGVGYVGVGCTGPAAWKASRAWPGVS